MVIVPKNTPSGPWSHSYLGPVQPSSLMAVGNESIFSDLSSHASASPPSSFQGLSPSPDIDALTMNGISGLRPYPVKTSSPPHFVPFT
jgi:hypothetical protein